MHKKGHAFQHDLLSGWGDLNPRLLDPEPSALPLRYSPNPQWGTGVTGLEPAVSGLTGRRDNQLRHTPIDELKIYRKQIPLSRYQDIPENSFD